MPGWSNVFLHKIGSQWRFWLSPPCACSTLLWLCSSPLLPQERSDFHLLLRMDESKFRPLGAFFVNMCRAMWNCIPFSCVFKCFICQWKILDPEEISDGLKTCFSANVYSILRRFVLYSMGVFLRYTFPTIKHAAMENDHRLDLQPGRQGMAGCQWGGLEAKRVMIQCLMPGILFFEEMELNPSQIGTLRLNTFEPPSHLMQLIHAGETLMSLF